ncbi:predicted protein [Phaeodactylum tricornutum CCAP 1055/1]|jgi:glutathione S-transferase|uniref:Glutathione S-transferase n=1 Tax=Phaeodactylum tricornutum (strain CCAP 1055/1) TaxID=556484 RepID=B5Y428_PHATC|nr:predicted protein [Phaeodactylum tricornutum CCAP 1055/1]ACI65237.1 predicted protein [Phaeodactylum tricornutum CCAP 1055/1]|eukprot:XP_002185767.1 predicted protein [Phaeodactylum tricornutum CCAP 1055/1]
MTIRIQPTVPSPKIYYYSYCYCWWYMGLVTLAVSCILRPPALLVHGWATTPTRVLGIVGRTSALVASSAETTRHRHGASLSMSQSPSSSSFGSILGNLVSSSWNRSNSGPSAVPGLDQALIESPRSSWNEIRSLLESRMTTNAERNFRNNLSTGYGVASPLHNVRLYDEANQESDVRVTFYRDSASWCPYCQKVWMTLEEKRIPYRVERVNMRCYGDKPASFFRIQPGGQIPVAVIDGKVYGQSNDILYALEEAFPQHKSLAPPQGMAMEAQRLLRLERSLFSVWMYWLTGGRQRDEFRATLAEVETALAQNTDGPFFLGRDVTMVDCMFAPFLERMAASLLYFKGFQFRVAPGVPTDYPAINAWFDAMETRESYQLTKSDYYTHCWDLPPQLGGCVYEKGGEPFEQAINGDRRLDGTHKSWELPLAPHNGGIEPDWEWAGDEAAARREAVERVSANHQAIVKFAARGAGTKGLVPFSAPLADPKATPNEAVLQAVDTCLQIVCLALLEGTDKYDTDMVKVAHIIQEKGGQEFTNGVVASLAYLRDRVGVPRDMRLPAARQLRAHLNWSVGKLLDT